MLFRSRTERYDHVIRIVAVDSLVTHLILLHRLVFEMCIRDSGSFFIANNLVPYANKKFFRTIYALRQMNQTLEFQDGLLFNGIDGLSIRVGHQNQETGLLTEVLIYDNRNASCNMRCV